MHIIYKRMSTYIDLNKYQKLGKIFFLRKVFKLMALSTNQIDAERI